MPEYQYRAVDAGGKGIRGVMSAADEAALEASLLKTGHWLVEARQQRGIGAISSALEGKHITASGSRRKIRPRTVKRRIIIDFCLQTGSLLEAGVSLLEALKTMADDASEPYFQQALREVVTEVEGGEHLYAAMEQHPKLFQEQIVSMIKAGEQSGTLPESFNELAKYLEWLEGLVGDIRQATIYPATILVVLVLFVTVLYTFVVPKFVKLLTTMKVALPLPTVVVITVSDMFAKYWWVFVLAALALPMARGILYKRSERFAFAWDSMKLKLPVLGEMNRMFAISRFTQNFSTLFKAGIPILQALDLCKGLVGNKVMEKAMAEAKADVEAGMMMSETFRRHDIFPPMVLRMLSVGEATSEIGRSLDNVSRHYSQEIPRRLKKVFAIMEPAILLVLIGIVGFTALAIFMPILSIYGSIGG